MRKFLTVIFRQVGSQCFIKASKATPPLRTGGLVQSSLFCIVF